MTGPMRSRFKNRTYGVGELARLSGVSVRTLHHYHAIGLLAPTRVGENGYRIYGRDELLRLQQILFHRELGLSLAEIAAVLDAPGFDQLAALRRHRTTLRGETERLRRLLGTLDRTIAELEGDETMTDADLYKGFAPAKQAEYEAYLIARYGEPTRTSIEAGKRRMASMSREEMQAHLDDLSAIEADLTGAFRAGMQADDAALDPVLSRHHAWIAVAWSRTPSAEAYAGLGDLYVTHPDFVARFEAMAPGLAAWLQTAMAAFASRKL